MNKLYFLGKITFKQNFTFKEVFMKSEKHIKVTGYSNLSWKDAIVKSVEEASKTLDHLTSIEVLKQKANIQDNKISEYSVDLDITFQIENVPNLISNNDEQTDL
jgi:flavin-binding protein dodecin